MALPPDVLAERARLKKESQRWRMLAFAVLFGGLIATTLWTDKKFSPTSSYIARIDISGFIGDDDKRDEMLDDLIDNKRVKAVLVRMDSPGGSATGGEELNRKLLEISKKKPIVALMRTTCTSACYMAAIGTDRIFAMDSSITGSIGVLLEMAEFTELAKKIGVNPITVKSGHLKASPSPFEKFTDEDRDYIQGVVNSTFQMFLDLVNARRKLNPDTQQLIKDGRIFTGRQAKKNGLIDDLGGQKEAVAWLEKDKKLAHDLPIKDVEPAKESEGLFAQFQQSAKGLIFGTSTQKLDGLVSIWQPAIK